MCGRERDGAQREQIRANGVWMSDARGWPVIRNRLEAVLVMEAAECVGKGWERESG